MKKRGQITIFIVLGIIILAVTGISFFIFNSFSPVVGAPDSASIENFIQTCIDSSLEEAVNTVAKNGGYSSFTKSFTDSLFKVKYWYFVGDSIMPSLKAIEEQIAIETRSLLDNCLDDFNVFKKEGYEVINSNIVSDDAEVLTDAYSAWDNLPIITISNDNIRALFPMQLILRKGEVSKLFDIYAGGVNVPFGLFYDLSKEIIDLLISSPESICLSCLSMIGNKNNIVIKYERYGADYFMTLEGPKKEFTLHWAAGYSGPRGILVPPDFYFDYNLFDDLTEEQTKHVLNVLEGNR